MSNKLAHLDQSVLVVVDIQPKFIKAIVGIEAALRRCKFLIECAQELGVPMLATEQYPERMGGTHPEVLALLDEEALPKMRFSCCQAPGFMEALETSGRKQAVILGFETPICVCQTAHELLAAGYEVIVAADATGSRSDEAQRITFDRLRDAGAIVAHTESIVYEWMGGADNPSFKAILGVLKKYAG